VELPPPQPARIAVGIRVMRQMARFIRGGKVAKEGAAPRLGAPPPPLR
jgi:hypothetical protein